MEGDLKSKNWIENEKYWLFQEGRTVLGRYDRPMKSSLEKRNELRFSSINKEWCDCKLGE